MVLPWLFHFSSLGHEYEFLLQQKLDEAGFAYLGENCFVQNIILHGTLQFLVFFWNFHVTFDNTGQL